MYTIFMDQHNTNPIDDIIQEEDASETSGIPNPEHDGLVNPEDTVNSNSDAPPVGSMGHPGVDEGTE